MDSPICLVKFLVMDRPHIVPPHHLVSIAFAVYHALSVHLVAWTASGYWFSSNPVAQLTASTFSSRSNYIVIIFCNYKFESECTGNWISEHDMQ